MGKPSTPHIQGVTSKQEMVIVYTNIFLNKCGQTAIFGYYYCDKRNKTSLPERVDSENIQQNLHTK